MRNLLIGLAAVALVACGGNNDTNNGTNNGTAGSNNGTVTNNDTTATNNDTTATNNDTTATNNDTTTTNNDTTGTNNDTTGTNNDTTGTNNDTAGTNNDTTGPSANCAKYCELALANCSELYADDATCQTACAAFDDDGTDCTDPSSCAAASTGVQCRVYHANAAATDAATHCPHASADGGGVCN